MEKLFALANLGQRTYGTWLLQRLLPAIVAIIGLTIITSIMISAMLVGSLYAAYIALLYYGTEPHTAMLMIGIAAAAIIALLVILTLSCIRRLRHMPLTLLKGSHLSSNAAGVVSAFAHGLMAKSP